MSTGIPSMTPHISSSVSRPEDRDINTATGVELTPRQRIAVGSLLELFAGRPSLKHLQIWTDDAKFNNPLTKAQGRRQYEAQWYGLAKAFSEIEQLSHTVTSAGNPLTMDLSTRYKLKGIGKQQIINSEVRIFLDAQGRIKEVQDRWNHTLPEGRVATAFRNMNAMVIPAIVRVPKNLAEERKMGGG